MVVNSNFKEAAFITTTIHCNTKEDILVIIAIKDFFTTFKAIFTIIAIIIVIVVTINYIEYLSS